MKIMFSSNKFDREQIRDNLNTDHQEYFDSVFDEYIHETQQKLCKFIKLIICFNKYQFKTLTKN